MKRFLAVFTVLLLLLTGCSEQVFEQQPTKILFLYTNDEHGHIVERNDWFKSVALEEMWEEEAERCPGCQIIKLSGGDNFTGTAVSTYFNGEPTAKIMDILGYRLGSLGNHELDFGTDALDENSNHSRMPYICANMLGADQKPIFAPSILYPIKGGGKILFVGSVTEDYKSISISPELEHMYVKKPFDPVAAEIEKKENQKADFVVLLLHESHKNAETWVPQLPKKPLIAFTAHDHKESMTEVDGIPFIQNKGYLPTYARVLVEKNGKEVKIISKEFVPIRKEIKLISEKSKKIKHLTDHYIKKLNGILGDVLITANKPVDGADLQKLYACATLKYYPGTDVTFSNPGGFRDKIGVGAVKRSNILSIFPFENPIYIVDINGVDLVQNLELSEEAYCGAKKVKNRWMLNGSEITPNKQYKAVVHEFIFKGGDGYKINQTGAISAPEHWRTPFEKFLRNAGDSGKNLEQAYSDLMREYGR